MNRYLKGLTIAAGLAALTALPAQAQTGWGSLGIHTSYQRGGELASDAPEPLEDFSLDEAWTVGGSLEFWMGSSRRLGLRFDGSVGESGFEPLLTGVNEDSNDVRVWMGDANLMLRLRAAEPGRSFLPYLTAGAGGVRWEVSDELVGDYPDEDLRIEDDQGEFAWTFGVGSDFFLNDNVSLRLEAKDYWYADSPYHHISVDDDFGGGHNVQLRAGLNFFWGNRPVVEEPGFIQEELEVIPEPEPEPEPEPAPATETVRMCVVNDNGTFETVTATRYIDTDRTVVTRSGREVTFTTAYPATSPLYVRGARWYMNDDPITVDIDSDEITRFEFVRFGGTTTVSTNNLVFVGEVDGTPVWVNRTELGTLEPRFRTALTTEDDLEEILRDDPALAADFSDVETLYVAVEPGNPCVFQPISLTTHVRATRGL